MTTNKKPTNSKSHPIKEKKANSQNRVKNAKGYSDKINPRSLGLNRKSILNLKNRDPNFLYRWIILEEGKIQAAQSMGYVLCKQDEVFSDPSYKYYDDSIGDCIKKIVNPSGRKGVATHALLMKCPMEIYEENQRIKQTIPDKYDDVIYGRVKGRGSKAGLLGEIDYLGEDTIKLK